MRIYILLIAAFLTAFSFSPGFYDFQFISIEGVSRQTSEFKKTKIVVVILPSTQEPDDLAYLQRLDSMSKVYNKIVMIGVPSYENSNSDSAWQSLKTWYRNTLESQFIITERMYTRKTYGSIQHALFKWLTNKDQNMHFDDDIKGAGQQFFINEQGLLFGVAGPEAKMSNNLFARMMQ